MELKIHNSEVISIRISGKLYYHLLKRADARKLTISEYCKNALIKYTEYKDNNYETDQT